MFFLLLDLIDSMFQSELCFYYMNGFSISTICLLLVFNGDLIVSVCVGLSGR